MLELDLTAPLEAKSKDEVGDLARVVNFVLLLQTADLF